MQNTHDIVRYYPKNDIFVGRRLCAAPWWAYEIRRRR